MSRRTAKGTAVSSNRVCRNDPAPFAVTIQNGGMTMTNDQASQMLRLNGNDLCTSPAPYWL
jgi:hypothetical protein